MKTRMELWQGYREEIEKNIALHEAVRSSDARFLLLEKKLLNVFPKYHSKYGSKLSVVKANVSNIPKAMEFETKKLEEVIATLSSIDEDHGVSFASIDGIDFSSNEMDDIIAAVQKGKIKDIDYVSVSTRTISFALEEVKKVNLGVKMRKIRIAIDGPSGSGKSTAAKLIAKKHGFNYINTGLIYRAIALNGLNNKIDFNNATQIVNSFEEGMIELKPNEVVFLKGVDVTKALRNDLVSQNASKVAAVPKIREFALEISRQYAKLPGTVMDGRDTTFKIMPDADLKIFLDTAPEVRAKRRVEQNRILGFDTNYDNILKEIKERDHRDRTREIDPLHKTEDAYLIDSSDMNIEQVVKAIEKLISEIK